MLAYQVFTIQMGNIRLVATTEALTCLRHKHVKSASFQVHIASTLRVHHAALVGITRVTLSTWKVLHSPVRLTVIVSVLTYLCCSLPTIKECHEALRQCFPQSDQQLTKAPRQSFVGIVRHQQLCLPLQD